MNRAQFKRTVKAACKLTNTHVYSGTDYLSFEGEPNVVLLTTGLIRYRFIHGKPLIKEFSYLYSSSSYGLDKPTYTYEEFLTDVLPTLTKR